MKKLSVVLLLFSLAAPTSQVFSQIVFSKEYGGAYSEDGRWMEQLPDSGFILVGGTNTYSNGQEDIWLVRTDAYGNTVWTKSIGGTQFDFANMVKPTSDGGFIIAGLTNSYGAGGNDGYLVKTNSQGVTQWQQTYGDTGLQELEAVIPVSDGYVALGVNYSAGTQYYDMYLLKTDLNGVKQWSRNIGGQGYEIGNSVQQTADGGFVLSGQSYSYGLEDGDFILYKTDSLGNVQWQKNYDFPGLQESHYVQLVNGGGYIMVGDADDLPNSLGSTDIFVIRTDANGDTLWTHLYGGTKRDGGKTIENTSDGGFIIGGITRSFNVINPNFYLGKLDGNGTVQWQNYSYGSAYHDHGYRAIETSDGGYAIFGFFRNSSNYMNYALVKLGPSGGVTKDVAADDIFAPGVNICRSYSVPIQIVITNYGATNETNIPVVAEINDGSTTTVIQDTFPGPISASQSQIFTLSTPYDFTNLGTYNLTAYIIHRGGDISYSNDTISATITVLPVTNAPSTQSGVSCTSGTVQLGATPQAAADSLFWYTTQAGNTLVSTGSAFTTPSLSSTTSYYVEAVKGKGAKCGPVDNTIGGGSVTSTGYLKFDSRVNFKLISVKVFASTAGNRTIQLRNSGGSVLQSKTINLPVGESRVYLNFDVPTANDLQLGLGSGSVGLFRNSSGVSYPYDVSRVLEIYGSSGGTSNYYYFYDWYVFVPYGNCTSNRSQVDAIIGTGNTSAFDKTRCGTGSVTLTANASQSVGWYDAPTGGTLLGSNNSYTTPSLSSTTTYYLQVGSCSGRIPVQAIISSTSAAPAAPNVSRCGPGTVTLIATASDPVSWYDAASGGILLANGNSYTTPFLNASKTYYAVAGTDCPSAAVACTAVVNSASPPTVTDATACGPASVVLTASSPDPVAWFVAPTGGSPITTTYNFTTPILNQTTTYYAEAVNACPSPRSPATAHITVVDPPVGTDASRCGPGSVVISASSIDPVTWWTAASGGTQLGSGINYTTPSISTTTTYYAQASNSGCNSVRTAVMAIINITQPPVVTSGSHCGPGTVTLTANSPDSISWYDASSGGNLLGTGSSFTTPVISATTTYYVQAGLSCPSIRVSVDAIISSQAADPTVTDGSRCGTGTVDISASSPDPVNWYDSPGGTLLGSGSNFTTPSISSTTTYYAVAGIPGCYSNAVPVDAVVNPQPADPVVTGAENCGPGQLTLTATASDSITWFDAASGGNVVATGGSYSFNFTATTTYYVGASNGLCSSNLVPVTASIWTVPAVTLGPDTINIISGQIINLNAGSGFTSYLWNTNATTQTINVSATGIYSVTVTDSHNCTGGDSIYVNVMVGVVAVSDNLLAYVYPNPSSGRFFVVIDNATGAFNLEVTDALGRVVFREQKQNRPSYQKLIDLSAEAKGIYYLHVSGVQGDITRRLIIE